MSSDNKSYHAFISYRHADNVEQGRQWATWLHQAIETYEVPKDLIGKNNDRGDEIAERIFPVFRDEKDLPADADLGSAITKALDKTRILIVLCSPNARQSKYVSDEIDYFKKQGHSDRVLAVLIDGEPNTSWDDSKHSLGFSADDECFPTPLQYIYDENGNRTEERAEPIAADLRVRQGNKKVQGWTSPKAYRKHLEEQKNLDKKTINQMVSEYELQLREMLLKIISGILGVSFERLNRRDKAYQLEQEQKKAKRLRRWLSAVTLLAVVAIGAGFYAFNQQQLAIEQRDKAEALLDNVRENLSFMNFDLRDVLKKYAPTAERVKVMERIDALSESLSQYGNEPLNDQRKLAVVLLQKAEVILISANQNPREALPLIESALATFEQLAKHDPANTQIQGDLSISHDNLGDIQLRLGNTDTALQAYQASLTIRQRLEKQDPTNTEFQRDLSISHNNLGKIQLRLGNTDAALTAYQASLTIAEQLAKQDPTNTEFQRDLSVSHNKLGNIQLRLGNTDAALTAYQTSLTIREQLAKQDPTNTQSQRDLFVSYWMVHLANEALGLTEAALQMVRRSHDQLVYMHEKGSLAASDKRLIEVANDKIKQLEAKLVK
jgi:tetratricopeptide (TPR) repeat protein